jgi:hypothetical protein
MVLNVAAVGLSLAAVVSAGFNGVVPGPNHVIAMATGVPTLILGMVWAWLLRIPGTVGNTGVRSGWAASVPLAMFNASIAAGVALAFERSMPSVAGLFGGMLLGATLGAIVWIPALVATLVCFGLPIAWAQRLAKKGLAGEERGEWIVGLVCVVMGIAGLLLSVTWPGVLSAHAGTWMTRAFGLLGALAGASSAGIALARERRRRRFVAGAEAGEIAGYRVDATEEGKVLVRVVSQGEGYRVADFEEEVFELDAAGEATRPKEMRRAR